MSVVLLGNACLFVTLSVLDQTLLVCHSLCLSVDQTLLVCHSLSVCEPVLGVCLIVGRYVCPFEGCAVRRNTSSL